MKKLIAVLLALGLLFSLAGCFGAQKSTIEKVVMTYVASPLNVPSVLERERGDYAAVFKKMGLEFEYSNLDSGADQTAALASGDIQILNAVGGSSVLLAAANGADIVILSMYSRAPKAFAMFSNDAALTTPESLRGKTIAGPKGTNLHELLDAYLATANMTQEDVQFVSMDIPSASAALESGSIDVALLGGAAAYQCAKSGKHQITDGEGLIPATIVTACTRAFAEANPEIVEAFRTAQKNIVNDMLSDTEAALTLTANALDLDLQDVQAMYAMYDFNTEITQSDIEKIQSTESFLYNAGLIETHVDVPSLIY